MKGIIIKLGYSIKDAAENKAHEKINNGKSPYFADCFIRFGKSIVEFARKM